MEVRRKIAIFMMLMIFLSFFLIKDHCHCFLVETPAIAEAVEMVEDTEFRINYPHPEEGEILRI